MRTDDCTCLALYDWQGEFSAREFHEIALQFFEDNRVVPDVASLSLEGKSGGARRYKTIVGRLATSESAPTAMSLFHSTPNYAQIVFGWDVTAEYNTQWDKTMYFCCEHKMAGLGIDYIARFVSGISHRIRPTYGIGYSRPFNLGPAIYAYGMIVGLDYSEFERILRNRIGAWFRERGGQNRHLTGHLRDVYPLNVISAVHLDSKVAGLPLGDWIAQDPTRGSLRPLARGAWLWLIEDARIPAIRHALQQAALLIAVP